MNTQLNVIIRFELESMDAFDELLALIMKMGAITTKAPCFISAKFHTNDDRTKLINYSTWESAESYEKFWAENVYETDVYKKILAFHPQVDKVFPVTLGDLTNAVLK